MMRRRRLRFLATRYPHWGEHAGIGQFTRHLSTHGFDLDYHLVPDDDSQLPLPRAEWRDGLRNRVQRSGMAWYKLSDLAAEIRSLVACAAGRAQLVHFLDGEHGVQFLPRWLDHLPGPRVRVVASYHQPPDLLPQLVDPKVLQRLDAVVLVSPSQQGFFQQYLPDAKIITILHGVDTDFFRPAQTDDDGMFRCVTAGHWLRDWATMREVASALQDDKGFEFHVVTSRQTGLEALPNVHFHQGLSDEALVQLYQRCNAALLPLLDSTANNTLLEAISCGLPLLSTDIQSVRAYVNDSQAVLFAPGSKHEFTTALQALKRDGPRRAALGTAARLRAEELAWPKVALQYAGLYSRLLND